MMSGIPSCYAEQNEKDHAALASAVAAGSVEAQPGV